MSDVRRVALIQGASGGLGRALAERALTEGAFDQVILTSRDLSRLDWASDPRASHVALDLSDDLSVERAAQEVAERCDQLNLVITTAGLLSDPARGISPEKKLLDLERAALQAVFDVNCFGPFLWYRALHPLLRHRGELTLATLSARVGSISDNRLGGWYSYRASKAAQSMMTKTLSLELGRYNSRSIVVGLHPGTVDTALSRPFQSRVPPERLFSPERAARQLWEVIQGLRPAQTGQCLAWDGSEVPA